MNINDSEDFEYDLPSPIEERPRGARFGEGQPTNLGGRPKGSPNLATMARRVANKRHRVTIEGKTRRMSTIELVLLSVKNKAALGDVAAFDLWDSLLSTHEPAQAENRGLLITGTKFTEEEWFLVYGHNTTDDEIMEVCPYLMPERRRVEAQRRHTQELVEQSERQYRERAQARKSQTS